MRIQHIVVALALLLSACKPDPCKDTDCRNGTCEAGECLCLPGYDGTDCSQLSRERFLGNWTVSDLCGPSATIYDCRIESGGPLPEMVFENLGDQGLPVKATAQGLAFDIPLQPFGQWSIRGGGLLDTTAREISLDYTVDWGGGNSTTCLTSLYPQ
jgi:hypothetical protein